MFKINQVFQQHDRLKPLLAEVENHVQWQQLWTAAAPEFSALSHVLTLSENTLMIAANSGMVANRIRLLEPELLRRMQQIIQKSRQIKGLNLIAIRVKVQVKNTPPVRRKRIQPLSHHAQQALQACAETIQNPALQHALTTLLKHQKQR